MPYIKDHNLRFQYKFPFYRMNILHFIQKLNHIEGYPLVGINTEFINIDEFKKEFEKSEVWVEGS